jgi:DNA-binding LytR/AlgR family response regulator
VLPEIVFITAYDQYAVEAFEQGVADYVLKPAERDRLQLTVERIRAAPGKPANTAAPRRPPARTCSSCCTSWRRAEPRCAPQYLQWIQATVGQAIQMIPVARCCSSSATRSTHACRRPAWKR